MRRRRVPFVAQMQAVDCGAACLTALVRSYGHRVSMREVRTLCKVGRDGTRAGDLARGARTLGFAADGVRAQFGHIEPAMLPAVAHLREDHYLVVERIGRRWVMVMDPALGRRRIAREDLERRFSGILLWIRPDGPVATGRSRTPVLPRVVATYRRLLRVLGRRVAAASVATAILQTSALLTPIVVANAARPRGLTPGTVVAVTLTAAAVFAVLVAVRGRLVLAIKVAHDENVTSGLVDHLARLDLAYFHTRSTGDLLSRLTSTASVRDALSTAAVTSVVDAATAVIYLGVLVALNAPVGFLALALSALVVAVPVVSYRWTRVHALTQLEKRSAGAARLVTMLLGIEQAKAHAAEHALVSEWRSEYVEELGAMRRAGIIDSIAQTITATCILVATPALVLVAQATTGSVVLAIGFGLSGAAFLGPVGNLTTTVTGLIATYAHLMRIEDILEEPAARERPAATTKEPVAVHVDRVSYSYPGAAQPAVDDVSLTIAPGGVVAVVGESGCGKSTLARVVAGLLHASAGNVRFADAHGAQAWPTIGYVAQSVALYPGTIGTNITFGRDASRDAIRRAVSAAGLDDFVSSLRRGLDTPVLDSGQVFSGGQRQRIAIARALLDDPGVLILDEATSNLDAGSEEHVLRSLSAIPSTKIIVAHHPAALRYADAVVHMHQGRVVEVRGPASQDDCDADHRHAHGAD